MAAAALHRQAHVLEHAELAEHGRDLERAHQPQARHRVGRRARDVVALVADAAGASRR
jgi:hypothetical protein